MIRTLGTITLALALLGAASAQALTQPLDGAEQPAGVASNPWGPEYLPEPKATFVGITAQRRRVERGKAAVLTVWVSPCTGRKGESVALLRNGFPNGTRFLSRACTAHFLRRIHSGTTFGAVTHEERGYLPGESRPLKIRIAPRRRP